MQYVYIDIYIYTHKQNLDSFKMGLTEVLSLCFLLFSDALVLSIQKPLQKLYFDAMYLCICLIKVTHLCNQIV